MSFRFGNRSKGNISGLTPMMKMICERALMETKVDFTIIDGLRTKEQQYKLFIDGKSECDGIDILSEHQSGNAIDFIIANGLPPFDQSRDDVKASYLEVIRAFLRSARLLGVNLELGITYDISGETDIYHIQLVKDK